MNRKFVIDPFDSSSIDRAIRGVKDYQRWLEEKSKELCERLAAIGATRASLDYAGAFYQGEKDVQVSVEPIEGGYKVLADGESVLFIEFGSGVTYGYGHPEAGTHQLGPGTYPPTNPEKPHWNDPKGWYLPKDKGGGHTYGNPPAAGMYNARKEIEQQIRNVVREVFGA